MVKPKAQQWWQFTEYDKPPDDLPTPECFSGEEWSAYYAAEEQAVWNKKSIGTSIRKDMCEDCTLVYQISQVKAGRCRPYFGAITPIHRFATIIGGGDDPIKQRKSRVNPWSDEDE